VAVVFNHVPDRLLVACDEMLDVDLRVRVARESDVELGQDAVFAPAQENQTLAESREENRSTKFHGFVSRKNVVRVHVAKFRD